MRPLPRAHPPRRKRCRWTAVLLGAFALACSQAETPDAVVDPGRPSAPWEAVDRYVDAHDWLTPLPPLLSSGSLLDLSHVRASERTDRGFVLETDGKGPATVEWYAALDADSIFEVGLAAVTDQPCEVELGWRRADQDFDVVRSVRWQLPAPGAYRSRQLIRAAKDFIGEIAGLRLRIEADTAVRLAVEDFHAYGWDVPIDDSPRADAALVSLRFVDEVRPAFVMLLGESREQVLPAGRWQLRGAAAHPGAGPRRLVLEIDGDIDEELSEAGAGPDHTATRTIEVAPVHEGPTGSVPAIRGWTPIRWDVSIGEGGATLRYHIEPETLAEDGRTPVFVAALRPIPRDGERPPRAVLVSLDTLRRDVLGLYGASGDPSPAIDGLARRSWVFDHAYATSPWTLPSHVSLLTGLDAARHGVEAGGGFYPASAPSLARSLREAGFWTEAWVEGGFVDSRFGLANGFDRFVVLGDYHRIVDGIAGSLTTLGDVPGPSFLFLHTYQAHSPYDPDHEAFARLAGTQALPDRAELWRWLETWRIDRGEPDPEQVRLLWSAYRAGVHKLDAAMAIFLEGLEALPPAEPDVLVVTSDHGEAFYERSQILEHHSRLEPELLSVPLIVSTGPDMEPARIDALASIADVAATITTALGVEPPNEEGRPLLEPLPPRAALAASVQDAAEPAYRYARIERDRIRSLTVDSEGSHVLRHSTTGPETVADTGDRREIVADWARDQRGRTEIALRLPEAVRNLPIHVRSSGEIVDALSAPAIRVDLRRIGPHEVKATLDDRVGVDWVTLLLELSPPDAGLEIEIPESAGPIVLFCGDQREPEDPAACHAAIQARAKQASLDPNVAAPSFAGLAGHESEPTARIRIVRHPGEPPFGTARRKHPVTRPIGLDPDLVEDLRALGYASDEPAAAGAEASPRPGHDTMPDERAPERAVSIRRSREQ